MCANLKTNLRCLTGAVSPTRYLQSLRVARYVPGHAAEPLAMTVHCSPSTGALGRARLAVNSAGQDQNSHKQPERNRQGAARANGAQSSHHHCGKWGAT